MIALPISDRTRKHNAGIAGNGRIHARGIANASQTGSLLNRGAGKKQYASDSAASRFR